MIKIITTLSLLFFIACGMPAGKSEADNTTNHKLIDGWKTLNSKEYSIQYPPTWELSQKGEMGTVLILFSALENGEDLFMENVNLEIEKFTDNTMDLDRYAEYSFQQLKKYVTDITVVESKKIKNANATYFKKIITCKQGILELKAELYYWVENNSGYMLTFQCEKNKFLKFKEVGENILNSFNFHLADSK